ncbi:MAG: hypothetical protein WCF92_02965 [bacterium]
MNDPRGKILKPAHAGVEKIKDEERGIASLCRQTKLSFLPKFCLLDGQVSNLGIFINGYF